MKNYLIFAGSAINNLDHVKPYLIGNPHIICADSGARHAKALNVKPHQLIGDFDSISKQLLALYRDDNAVEVIDALDQNLPDLEKALRLVPKEAQNINIFGALGGRMDHLFANILTLENHSSPERFTLHDECHHIHLLTKDYSFKGHIGDKIGVLPLRDINTLEYEGLLYPANSLEGPYNLGWLGTSNEMSEDKATIKLDSGLALLIHYKPNKA
jgi:thiamine pyrophosphokinase